jgi:hypothetical protein
MALILGNGSRVEGSTSAFRIRNPAGTNVFEQGVANYNSIPFGYYNNVNIPMFAAGSGSTADPGWLSITDSTWTKVNGYCNTVSINRGSCYDTSATRFNAPISGPYLFIWHCYCYQNNYYHCSFGVNGSTTTRHGANTKYRIRGYGYYAGYATDSQIEEVVYLQAGDYVEVFHYGSTAYYYPSHGQFAGIYVG